MNAELPAWNMHFVLSVRQIGLDKGKTCIHGNVYYLFIGREENLRRLFWGVGFNTQRGCFTAFSEPHQLGLETKAGGQTLALGTAKEKSQAQIISLKKSIYLALAHRLATGRFGGEKAKINMCLLESLLAAFTCTRHARAPAFCFIQEHSGFCLVRCPELDLFELIRAWRNGPAGSWRTS